MTDRFTDIVVDGATVCAAFELIYSSKSRISRREFKHWILPGGLTISDPQKARKKCKQISKLAGNRV